MAYVRKGKRPPLLPEKQNSRIWLSSYQVTSVILTIFFFSNTKQTPHCSPLSMQTLATHSDLPNRSTKLVSLCSILASVVDHLLAMDQMPRPPAESQRHQIFALNGACPQSISTTWDRGIHYIGTHRGMRRDNGLIRPLVQSLIFPSQGAQNWHLDLNPGSRWAVFKERRWSRRRTGSGGFLSKISIRW
jgi:hypothetical protein